MKKVGAGGNWKRIDEKFDSSIIKQTSGLSCVSAVGEMLLKQRGITLYQAQILDIIGEPAHFGNLAKMLNEFDILEKGKQWHGIFVENENLTAMLRVQNSAIILREPFEIGHAGLIAGKTKNGLIKIKDPFDQSAYKMTVEDFLEYWNGEVIFYGRIK